MASSFHLLLSHHHGTYANFQCTAVHHCDNSSSLVINYLQIPRQLHKCVKGEQLICIFQHTRENMPALHIVHQIVGLGGDDENRIA